MCESNLRYLIIVVLVLPIVCTHDVDHSACIENNKQTKMIARKKKFNGMVVYYMIPSSIKHESATFAILGAPTSRH